MNHCTKCGTTYLPTDSYCSKCGNRMFHPTLKRVDRNFRKHFTITFVFALLTGFFWFMQRYVDNSTISFFAPFSALLSIIARVSFIVAFAARSENWLALSALASTTSLILGVVGSIPNGFYDTDWATQLTWLFSLSTLISYFIQSRNYGIKPFALTKK